ncbi:MAG: zinc ribbon domain-containing protein, partial [Candidatus Gastranaerophilales bacterium]|nr:zinc ribbon domain-containing protein [Candidatus Gastranaerophilales bacterium]
MICRKCGANLPDNVLRCSVCGIKVNMYCPECKTLNPFGAKVCKNCGFELIKICPDCRCVNIYSAKECHKCGHKFEITTPNTNKNESVKAVTEKKKPEFTPRPREDFDIVRPFSCTETAYSVSDLPDLSENADNIENTENTGSVEKENYTPEKNQYNTASDTNKRNKSESKHDIENIILPEIKPEQTTNSNNGTESAVLDNEENDKTSEIEKIFYVEKEPDIEEIQNLKEEPPVINPVDKDKKEEIINSVFDSEKIDIEPIQEVNVGNLNVHQEDTRKIIPETPQTNETDKEDLNVEVQPEAVKKIVHLLTSSLNKHIIAVNGEEGRGKSAVLNQVRNIMSTKGFVCLYGSCTPLIQITSFGFFQDAFLRILGFPPYTRNIEAFIKDFKKSSFSKVFSFLDGNELTLFLNIFYPDKKDKFDNILENRKIMFSILEKVIKS